MSTETETKLLDLDCAERRATVRFAGRSATHIFRPLTLEDWLRYFTTLAVEYISTSDEMITQSHEQEAADALWQEAILRVEGYQGDDWKGRMPLSHKVAALAGLQQVLATDAGDPFDLAPDSRLVRLEAAWNGEIHEGLGHRFRLPSSEDARDYRRLNVSFIRSRGRRDQALRIKACVRLGELCRLYDALILETEGYSGDYPKRPDPLHKMAAITALFEPPEAD